MMKRSYLIVFALVSVILLSLFTLPGCGQKGLEYNLLFEGTYEVTAGTEQTLNGKIVIPSTYKGKPVTHIGDDAFQNCKGLTSVTISASVTSIDYGTFSRCSGLTSITIPDSVTSIGKATFASCTGLTSVTIPDSVTFIGERAFSDCTALTSIQFQGTKAQWETIEKSYWLKLDLHCTVECTDGYILE